MWKWHNDTTRWKSCSLHTTQHNHQRTRKYSLGFFLLRKKKIILHLNIFGDVSFFFIVHVIYIWMKKLRSLSSSPITKLMLQSHAFSSADFKAMHELVMSLAMLVSILRKTSNYILLFVYKVFMFLN